MDVARFKSEASVDVCPSGCSGHRSGNPVAGDEI